MMSKKTTRRHDPQKHANRGEKFFGYGNLSAVSISRKMDQQFQSYGQQCFYKSGAGGSCFLTLRELTRKKPKQITML